MAKPLNFKRRLKNAEDAQPRKARDLNALALIVSRKGGHHGDARKAQSRKACRGRVSA
jgi:hypothetical protein